MPAIRQSRGLLKRTPPTDGVVIPLSAGDAESKSSGGIGVVGLLKRTRLTDVVAVSLSVGDAKSKASGEI